jgi:hypothetical protein
MPDTNPAPVTPAPVTPATATPRTRGYFNQAQIDDLELADTVIAAARGHAAEMEEQDITAAWLDGFESSIHSSNRQGPILRAVRAHERPLMRP